MNACVIIARKGSKGDKFTRRFHSFLKVFERDFLLKISHVDGKEWQRTRFRDEMV